MNILISSLGESPAVVTETVDAIEREERINIQRVITVGTSEWSVELSQEALREEFLQFDGGRIAYIPQVIEAKDLLTEENHLEFLNLVATNLRAYQFADVYLSLAGGRKTMSAVMTIAAQIYGAKMLCHVVPLDEELERRGEIHTWSGLPCKEQQRVLHPPADKVRLVRLPLVSLFPLLDDFLRALRGETADAQAVRLLENSHLVQREQGQIKRTASGEQLFKILSDIEQLPAPSPLSPDQKQVTIHDHGYGGKKAKVEAMAKKLATCPWVVSVQTIPYYGNKPRTAVRQVHDDGRIEIDVRTGEFSAGLEARTTAQTRGQAERVARELEKFLR
jgi:CRISPR-associated Csx14 family protein